MTNLSILLANAYDNQVMREYPFTAEITEMRLGENKKGDARLMVKIFPDSQFQSGPLTLWLNGEYWMQKANGLKERDRVTVTNWSVWKNKISACKEMVITKIVDNNGPVSAQEIYEKEKPAVEISEAYLKANDPAWQEVAEAKTTTSAAIVEERDAKIMVSITKTNFHSARDYQSKKVSMGMEVDTNTPFKDLTELAKKLEQLVDKELQR